MESEADRDAAPAAYTVASDDAIQEESPASAPKGKRRSEAEAEAAPEVNVQLFRRGRGPVAVFRSRLGGYTQDQLEVGDILEQHGLKSVFVFDPASRTRGVAIRFHPRNGRSLLTYVSGSTIFLDGEPKVRFFVEAHHEGDDRGRSYDGSFCGVIEGGEDALGLKPKLRNLNFPPWVLACMVIVFTRLRKRTKDAMHKFGWSS
ncbi:hypothetical protein ABZP36_017251 [Zizania latifolia]